MNRNQLAEFFEVLYNRFNQPQYIHPDPLEVVYRYQANADREIAGLIAATLAYGRVAHILANLDKALLPMGPSPREFLLTTDERTWKNTYAHFKHRWTAPSDLIALLAGIRALLERHGSIEASFARHHRPESGTTLEGLRGLTAELGAPTSLVSNPQKGSACKRLHLYLRWMIRRDAVDPGCWTAASQELLIVPLDTHLHRVARGLRLTRRKQPNLAAALDITRAFRQMNPADPLRYDFTLTRFGIRNEMDLNALLRHCRQHHPNTWINAAWSAG